MSGKTRSVFGTAFKHFVNSLKPRQTLGIFVGDDYHGNKYYEIPAGNVIIIRLIFGEILVIYN